MREEYRKSSKMFFYVDESGHTGPNLFDPAQPTLFYGLLSAAVNLDAVASPDVCRMRNQLGVARLHAAELGVGRLGRVAPLLTDLHRRYAFRFDLFAVQKADHAIICFVDQVFDSGVNPAVAWHHYWTPLRYVLLLKVASLFDQSLARVAWQARINVDRAEANRGMVQVCETLLSRVSSLSNQRSREVVAQGLQWAAQNPNEILYNAPTSADARSVMPNVIGFQSVLAHIASRSRKLAARSVSVIVDQQSQFNAAQKALATGYSPTSGTVLPMGPGMPVLDLRGMKNLSVQTMSSAQSVGLELTDSFLWLYRRILLKQDLPAELEPLLARMTKASRADEISLQALTKRWSKWFDELPEPTVSQLSKARELLKQQDAMRQDAIESRNSADKG